MEIIKKVLKKILEETMLIEDQKLMDRIVKEWIEKREREKDGA